MATFAVGLYKKPRIECAVAVLTEAQQWAEPHAILSQVIKSADVGDIVDVFVVTDFDYFAVNHMVQTINETIDGPLDSVGFEAMWTLLRRTLINKAFRIIDPARHQK